MNPKYLKVTLNEEDHQRFQEVKKQLGLTIDTEVVRHILKVFYDEKIKKVEKH